MREYYFILFSFLLITSCDGTNTHTESVDTSTDTTTLVEIPQLDISGPVEVGLTHGELEHTIENGMDTYVLHDTKDDDTLFIKYVTALDCEECRIETQIWRGDKYVDLVRDTGYGTGGYTRIPVNTLKRCSQDGSADYNQLALYLSVRQYHPVETGNKRFLFYLELK